MNISNLFKEKNKNISYIIEHYPLNKKYLVKIGKKYLRSPNYLYQPTNTLFITNGHAFELFSFESATLYSNMKDAENAIKQYHEECYKSTVKEFKVLANDLALRRIKNYQVEIYKF